jgi:hypothetical protein
MSSTEKIAIAAHLHVLLRRKTGRVTDTEWLASNAAYAAEIVRFSREKATEDGHVDLGVWADRLEAIMAIPDTQHRKPLAQVMADAVKARAPAVDTEDAMYPASGLMESIFGDSETHRQPERRDPDAPRYVKGLR